MSSEPSTGTILAHAVERAESDGGILVAGLASAWRRAFTEQTLEEVLGCPGARVDELALCLRPRAETWAADIEEIAGAIGIERRRLETFFRQAEIAEKLAVSQLVGDNTDGQLLAARDRDEST